MRSRVFHRSICSTNHRAAADNSTGDAPVLSAAQLQIRSEFLQKSNLSDAASVQTAIDHAEEIARVLRENVVQGQKKEGDEHSYSMPSRLFSGSFAMNRADILY